MDLNTSHNVVNIAELHVCYTPTACYENYVPPDGTSTSRGSFYGVTGFPTVYFDGNYPIIGATNSMSQMGSWYEQNLTSALSYAGNVSISQDATVVAGNVTEYANITSGITGSYNVVTYLLEYIGKTNVTNGNGPHDVGNIVRETLFNHPVSLTAGATSEINFKAATLPVWNQNNLSVVSFVQDNSTRIVENANMASVSALGTTVSASPTTIGSGGTSSITVKVTNLSTAAPVGGATVSLTTAAGGLFSPSSGITAAGGTFTTNFTGPTVSSTISAEILAQATAGGLSGFATTTISVTPLVPPTEPTGLTVTPGVAGVTLNWTAPSTGGGGVTYVVYDATAAAGPFTEVNVTTGTQYVVTGLSADHSYWYRVQAMDAGGYSVQTAAIVASAVTGSSQNLPSSAGWWVSIDSMNFTSTTSAALVLYLPDGVYPYSYGTTYYARVAANTVPAPITVSGSPASFSADFAPALATLAGTVSPANATVTLDGTAIAVANGVISERVNAGTYALVVSTPGYQTNTTNVTLQPGNQTNVTVQLQPVSAGHGNVGTSASGVSMTELLELVAIGVVGAVAVVGGVVMLSRRGRGRG